MTCDTKVSLKFSPTESPRRTVDGIFSSWGCAPRSQVHYMLGREMTVRTDTTSDMHVLGVLHGDPTLRVVIDHFRRTEGVIRLGTEARQIVAEPNAGGASVVSEAISAEYVCRRFNATDVMTEMRIPYFSPHWKKVDYLATIFGRRVGVSVTRAMGFPTADDFTFEDAARLCLKKLNGLVVARSGISPSVGYEASILHCWCQDARIAELMELAFAVMVAEAEDEVRCSYDNIVVLLTIARNTHEIFTEDFSCIA